MNVNLTASGRMRMVGIFLDGEISRGRTNCPATPAVTHTLFLFCFQPASTSFSFPPFCPQSSPQSFLPCPRLLLASSPACSHHNNSLHQFATISLFARTRFPACSKLFWTLICASQTSLRLLVPRVTPAPLCLFLIPACHTRSKPQVTPTPSTRSSPWASIPHLLRGLASLCLPTKSPPRPIAEVLPR